MGSADMDDSGLWTDGLLSKKVRSIQLGLGEVNKIKSRDLEVSRFKKNMFAIFCSQAT